MRRSPVIIFIKLYRSRPGTGKWCSMKACGNRAKNKTYRERAKSMG
ncbi:CGNR zinc finger domain-containing protein [Paenibacillus lautus]|nr:CGNR zinc finger domain-containing protein [Paenibacillus lautus]